MHIKNNLFTLVTVTMICSNLSGIEIADITASSESGTLKLHWQVHNNRNEPIYLLNVNEPLVEKKGSELHLNFRMIDTSWLFISREVAFRSIVKKIDEGSRYHFNLLIDSSRKFESPGFDKYSAIDNIDSLLRIVIYLGYTYEDISYVYYDNDEIGRTGGEVFKIKTDDGFQHISKFTREQVMSMDIENLISLIDVQQVMEFVIDLD